MDIELPLDFKEFLNLLNENQVEYLLFGKCAKKSRMVQNQVVLLYKIDSLCHSE
jgi:hypothetical protein